VSDFVYEVRIEDGMSVRLEAPSVDGLILLKDRLNMSGKTPTTLNVGSVLPVLDLPWGT